MATSKTTLENSTWFEGWEKWQVALAVGAPVCLGLAGLWFYNKSKQDNDQSNTGAKTKGDSKGKVKQQRPASSSSTSGTSVASKPDTPLAKAQECKENGNKCFKQGKYDEAIKCYTQALELCPEDNKLEIAKFYANRAAAYDKLKDPRRVVENCTEAIKRDGKYTKALSRRANAAEQIGDFQMSLEDVTAVCILEGFQNQSTLTMADRVLKGLGKQKAKEALKNKKPSMPSKHSIKSYFAAFTQDPIQLCFTESPLQESTKMNIPVQEVGEVEDTSEEKKELNISTDESTNTTTDIPQQPEQTQIPNGEQSEHSVFKEVVDKLKGEKFDELLPLCEQELSITPPTQYQTLARLLRAIMFTLMTQTDKALEDFNEILTLENLDKKVKVNALIRRGSLLINQNQQTEGLADFAQATRIDPNNSDIYHHRGHQNIQIDRIEDAIRDFENSIQKNPDFPNSYIQKSYAEHRRAAAEQSTTKLEKAVKSYEETIKKFPKNADVHALYAQALCDLGRFDDADNEFEIAIKYEPENANTLVQRALLNLQWKQKVDEPVKLIKEAIALDEKCEYAYEMLGTIEVQRGDMVKAVSLFERAIELSRTESEMSHLFSLLHAAKAQVKAAQTLGIPLPTDFSPM